jgi:p-cumate 2,3-dioxygenase beta subunit
MTQKIARADVEDFLYHEASLLDEWKLDDWAALFTEDGEYLVPPTDRPLGDPASTLFLVYDDHFRLTQRAKRLQKRQAHAESPASRTRHIIGNVRILGQSDGKLDVECNFVVYRTKRDILNVFPGRAIYQLVLSGDAGFRIRSKRCELTIDALRPQGRLSIIV